MYSFLLIGQSNMAGRGFRDEVAPIDNDRLYVLRNGRWQPMYVPVNPDRPFSGINLAESFAQACAKEYDTDVGLIPCADGGSCLDQWEPGGLLFDHAVAQAKLAMRTSVIAGVLWHQGESDCSDDRYPCYEEKCTRIFRALREKLGLEDVPFLVGGLGDYLPLCTFLDVKNYFFINEMLEKIAREDENIGFVSAEGLTANPDQLHFNAQSLRAFGLRYFEVFRGMNRVIGASAGQNQTISCAPIERL